MRSIVVLPAPLGPRRPLTPGAKTASTPSRATVARNRLHRPVKATVGRGGARGGRGLTAGRTLARRRTSPAPCSGVPTPASPAGSAAEAKEAATAARGTRGASTRKGPSAPAVRDSTPAVTASTATAARPAGWGDGGGASRRGGPGAGPKGGGGPSRPLGR